MSGTVYLDIAGHRKTWLTKWIMSGSTINKGEARELLFVEMKQRAGLLYQEFRQWTAEDKIDSIHITGESGTEYCMEIEAHWDDRPEGWIRVSGSIDDGRFLFLRSDLYAVISLFPRMVLLKRSGIEEWYRRVDPPEWNSLGSSRKSGG